MVISWIQRQFIAVRMRRGQREETWESPEPVAELPDFNRAVAAACEMLEIPGGTEVSIIYESDRLSHPLSEAPPMRRHDLTTFLQRKVNQLKTFEGEAAWGYTRTLPSRDGDSVALHLMPRSFVDAMVRICEEFHLRPVSLLPLSVAMTMRIRELAGQSDQVCMLVALFPFQCEIVVARGDGSLLFVRDLGYGVTGNEGRLVQEIGRSILFSGQRFSTAVDRIWIAGRGADAVAGLLAPTVTVAVEGMEDDQPVDWVRDSKNRAVSNNLLPVQVRDKYRRQIMLRWSAALTVALAVSSVLTAWEIEQLVRAQGAGLQAVEREINDLERTKARLQNRVNERQALQSRLDAFRRNALPPMAPLWVMDYLAEQRPAGVRLQHVSMKYRDGDQAGAWRLEIQGSAADIENAPRAWDAFESALAGPPLNAHVTESWKQPWVRALKSGASEGPVQLAIKGELK